MLNISHFSKTYPGGKRAVEDLSLAVPAGQIVGFIGHNGAGKTTTLRCAAGILDFSEGTIEIDGHDIRREPVAAKQVTAFLPDNPDLYEFMTGVQYLTFIADIYGIPAGERTRRVQEYAGAFELTAALGSAIGSYSHGMKQKLALISALMRKPRLLILDEPINGLDPIGIAEVRDFIRALCEERGKTILISSHILSEIALLADDIGIIDHGVLLEEESLVELEQKNGKVLRFTVSNATVAAQLLQKEMGVRDVAVENGRELTVRDLRLDTGAAVRRFVEAGLVVSDAHLYEDTLEDYFKRITGGEGIA